MLWACVGLILRLRRLMTKAFGLFCGRRLSPVRCGRRCRLLSCRVLIGLILFCLLVCWCGCFRRLDVLFWCMVLMIGRLVSVFLMCLWTGLRMVSLLYLRCRFGLGTSVGRVVSGMRVIYDGWFLGLRVGMCIVLVVVCMRMCLRGVMVSLLMNFVILLR